MASLLTGAALFLVGCSSTPDYHQDYANRLASSDAALEDGNLTTAHRETIQLIDTMEENGIEGYEVQRGLAEALLVAIHASASPSNGFLTEPGRFEFQLDSSGGGDATSETAHRIAAIFHGWRLLEREPQMSGASSTVGDVTIAPGRLALLLPTGMTKGFTWLIIAGSMAQLGFEDKSRTILRQFKHPEHGAVFTQEDAHADLLMVQVMNEYGLPPRLQWYLASMGYEVHRQRFEDSKLDPTLTYRLGCIAAFGPLVENESTGRMEHSGVVVDPKWKDDFYVWVQDLEEENGQFMSSDRTVLRSGVTICKESGEPAIDFEWTRNDD